MIETHRVTRLIRTADLAVEGARPVPFDLAVLTSEERHLRRRTIVLQHGDRVLVDFAEALMLGDRDRLEIEDGRHVEIVAAEEELYAVSGRDQRHLIELAWHIGNRHLAAQIEADRILIQRDPILRNMLEGLGGRIENVLEPFQPARGAYAAGGGHGHSHAVEKDDLPEGPSAASHSAHRHTHG